MIKGSLAEQESQWWYQKKRLFILVPEVLGAEKNPLYPRSLLLIVTLEAVLASVYFPCFYKSVRISGWFSCLIK